MCDSGKTHEEKYNKIKMELKVRRYPELNNIRIKSGIHKIDKIFIQEFYSPGFSSRINAKYVTCSIKAQQPHHLGSLLRQIKYTLDLQILC
jgi:hypothetical protein